MKSNEVYKLAINFLRRHPGTIAWRVKKHCSVAMKHINNDEQVLYAFAAQKGQSSLDIISTHVVVITDKRIIVAQKRLVFGYLYYSITPDMFNDFTIKMGLVWGNAIIDTIKETVVLSNLSRGALREVETALTKYIMQKKKELENGLTQKEEETLESDLRNISKNGED